MSFAELAFFGIAAGLGATLFADVFAVWRQGWAMTHGFYCLVGRWVGSLPQQGPIHNDIRSSKPIPNEAQVGVDRSYPAGGDLRDLFRVPIRPLGNPHTPNLARVDFRTGDRSGALADLSTAIRLGDCHV